jgi:hypothetical protein
MPAERDEDLDRIERPDIEIGAVVKAKRLRFNKKPRTKVHIEGEPGVDRVSGSERENLPETVEPGVTYRDVRVRWRAAGKLRPPTRGDDDG